MAQTCQGSSKYSNALPIVLDGDTKAIANDALPLFLEALSDELSQEDRTAALLYIAGIYIDNPAAQNYDKACEFLQQIITLPEKNLPEVFLPYFVHVKDKVGLSGIRKSQDTRDLDDEITQLNSILTLTGHPFAYLTLAKTSASLSDKTLSKKYYQYILDNLAEFNFFEDIATIIDEAKKGLTRLGAGNNNQSEVRQFENDIRGPEGQQTKTVLMGLFNDQPKTKKYYKPLLYAEVALFILFVGFSQIIRKGPGNGGEPISSTEIIPVTNQKLSIQKALLKSTDASGRPAHELGYYPTINPGVQKLFYFFGYQGASPKVTKFTTRWFKDGSQIYENKTLTAPAVAGEEWSAIDYNFQTGNYMVKLYTSGEELTTTWFNVGTSTGQPGPVTADIKITDDEYRQFIAGYTEYKKADSELSNNYSRLKSTLPESQREVLVQQQRQWIATRDRTAFEAGPKGSPGYMSALIQATNDRKNALLRDMPNRRPEPRPTPPGKKPDTSDMLSDMERDLRDALKK